MAGRCRSFTATAGGDVPIDWPDGSNYSLSFAMEERGSENLTQTLTPSEQAGGATEVGDFLVLWASGTYCPDYGVGTITAPGMIGIGTSTDQTATYYYGPPVLPIQLKLQAFVKVADANDIANGIDLTFDGSFGGWSQDNHFAHGGQLFTYRPPDGVPSMFVTNAESDGHDDAPPLIPVTPIDPEWTLPPMGIPGVSSVFAGVAALWSGSSAYSIPFVDAGMQPSTYLFRGSTSPWSMGVSHQFGVRQPIAPEPNFTGRNATAGLWFCLRDTDDGWHVGDVAFS